MFKNVVSLIWTTKSKMSIYIIRSLGNDFSAFLEWERKGDEANEKDAFSALPSSSFLALVVLPVMSCVTSLEMLSPRGWDELWSLWVGAALCPSFGSANAGPLYHSYLLSGGKGVPGGVGWGSAKCVSLLSPEPGSMSHAKKVNSLELE